MRTIDFAAELAAFHELYVGDRKRFPRLDTTGKIALDHGVPAQGWHRVDGVHRHFVNGVMESCEDGPASFSANSYSFMRRGKLHNEAGPALVERGGRMTWAVNGARISFKQLMAHKSISKPARVRLMLSWAVRT